VDGIGKETADSHLNDRVTLSDELVRETRVDLIQSFDARLLSSLLHLRSNAANGDGHAGK
jgi:hypothetical protein